MFPITYCISSSCDGVYPFVTAHAFPNLSHDDASVGLKAVKSNAFNPASFCREPVGDVDDDGAVDVEAV